jgi:hypothetical protein
MDPILCIPRVNSNINKEHISKIFNDLNIGILKRIDIVKKENKKEEKFNSVFLHIIWNNSSETNIIRNNLLKGKEIKIIYDDPWFWKVSAYNRKQPKLI